MKPANTATRILLLALILLVLPVHAVDIYSTLPDRINPRERYVFYSHGLIVEGTDEKPIHPEFGVYDFPAIKKALFKGGGFNLIAYHRPKNAAVEEHALMLERWVRTLLAAGVPASRITIVGFSRGSGITAYASARLRDVEINTALMGACANGDVKSPEPLVLGICSISTRPRTVFCRATCWRNAAS